jgi:hypothetical protein
MKNKILLIGAIVFMALPTSVWAADIVGNWVAHEPPSRHGSVATDFFANSVKTVFSFKVDGTTLTGTVSNHEGETAISEGRINGDEISFVVIRNFDGNAMKLVYKGKVELNEIKFTREAQGGIGQQQGFVAEREFQRNNGFVPVRITPVRLPPPTP